MDLLNQLNFFLLSLDINWVDIVVLVLIVVYAMEGYALGFLRSMLDLVSFISSFVLGVVFYPSASNFLTNTFSIPKVFANAVGFFLVALTAELVLSFLLIKFVSKLHPYVLLNSKLKNLKNFNNVLGVMPGILSAVVLLTFILTMITVLPVSPQLKQAILSSKTGSVLVYNSQGFEDRLNKIFGQAVSDALTFITVEPKSEESLRLNFKTKSLSVDREAGKEMLELLNTERDRVGLNRLIFDERLANSGRKHCRDMLERGYFSHYTPEGLSPFDRMAQDDVTFTYAGENLALAPSTRLAHDGLMRSPGHRENILSPNFGRVGIGVIDGGIYGKMFCQEFTD